MDEKLANDILGIMKSQNEYLIPMHPETYGRVISAMAAPFSNGPVNKVAAIETKGLLFGPLIAEKLMVPFVPVLKRSKTIPKGTVYANYSDYSGHVWRIRLFAPSISPGDRILLVDDWFDSGNTAKATIALIERLGGKIEGISCIVNQLKPVDYGFFSRYNFHYLVRLPPKKPGQKGRWKPE